MLEPQRYDHTCGNHDWFVHDLLLMPLDKSRNEEVRRFANRMIGDHSSVNDQACFAFSMSRLSAVYTMWAICGDQRSQRDHGSQLKIAHIGDHRVARAAFEEVGKRRPGRVVTLRQKTRLLADSRRKEG